MFTRRFPLRLFVVLLPLLVLLLCKFLQFVFMSILEVQRLSHNAEYLHTEDIKCFLVITNWSQEAVMDVFLSFLF